MKYEGLKKREGQPVNLYPRPRVLPDGREMRTPWLLTRVDRKARVVELQASSGHFKNLAPVIHKYEEAGNTVILDAQLFIDGPTVVSEPRPWGATTQNLRLAEQPKWGRMVSLDLAPQQMVAARLQMMNAAGDQVLPGTNDSPA